MATVVTDYKLSKFSYDEVKLGALCAVVASIINPNSYDEIKVKINDGLDVCLEAKGITHSLTPGGNDAEADLILDYKGKGVCRMVKTGNLCVTIKSVDYVFNNYGLGVSSNALGYKLLMLTIDEDSDGAVSSIPWSGYNVTRGYVDASPEDPTNINIVGMSARDEFANQALRGILSRIEDPFSLSDNEISYYCEAAYKWAAVMMLVAANARKNTSTGNTPTAAEITSLDSNIERLLNNILVAITENSSGSGGGSGTVSVQNTEDSNHNAVPLVISGNTTVNISSGNNNPLYVSIVDNS